MFVNALESAFVFSEISSSHLKYITSTVNGFGIKQRDSIGHVLPQQQLVHAEEKDIFTGLTAFPTEFTVGEVS
ncbi:hypothetical protein [Aeromonas caviae]|uniref:hypothetical protein n=1 Tax=Aeromonas caviae TaxID=648 RepID=UPI001C200F58|nr:hypothetical protein KAM462_36540 [Aeromonas caviae]GKR12419.1 hypothetical protein KAM465_39960 [Aeromonas caviae]GKR16665.1 hypothetical protein KAM466_39830 [Aeromonas caviae]GKR20960.1 hypothetical protein KAM467_40040 [Aeromonas caviae]GKR25357.1 hypothetical protein KAM468_40970 [Aeromonas caviae]